MEYFIGMAATMVFFSFCVWAVNRKTPTLHKELMEQNRAANLLAQRRAAALERIADALEDRNGQGLP